MRYGVGYCQIKRNFLSCSFQVVILVFVILFSGCMLTTSVAFSDSLVGIALTVSGLYIRSTIKSKNFSQIQKMETEVVHH